jgi:hypothetical protein
MLSRKTTRCRGSLARCGAAIARVAVGLTLVSSLVGCNSDSLDPLGVLMDPLEVPDALILWPGFSQDDGLYSSQMFAPATIAVLSPDETANASAQAFMWIYSGGFHPTWFPRSDSVSQLLAWSSSDADVASVDGNGKITAHKPGTATITAMSAKKRSVKTSANVTVLPQPLRFSTLDVGNGACGITTSSREVYCWGVRVGVPTKGETFDIGMKLKALPEPAASVSVGGLYFVTGGFLMSACALGESGAAYCWGANYGQLGDGTMTYRPTPVAVAGDLRFKAIATGNGATCALDAAGNAYCWGSVAFNGLDGAPDVIDPKSSVPVAVGGGLHFKSISVGVQACGIADDGTAYCWGTTPTPVPGNQKFVQIAAGVGYTCGLSVDHDVYCWGKASGGLGLGAGVTTAASPTLVPGGIKFSTISASKTFGGGLTCGLAIDGNAYCWGANEQGQIGADGVGSRAFAPTLVHRPGAFTSVAAGTLSACGISDGKAYCWGEMFGYRPATPSLPALIPGQGR